MNKAVTRSMNRLFHPLTLAIGLRYTRARRQSHFVSFISLASMIGIAIGVLVLIVVLSVMNGFEQAMRDRMLGTLAHVTVSQMGAHVEDWQGMQKRLDNFDEVEATAPFLEKPVMLNQGDEARGVLLQGVLPDAENRVTSVPQHVTAGEWNALQKGSYTLALGATVAKELGVVVGDSVTLISPSEDALASGELPALQRFKVAAIFRVDMQNYDSGFAYANLHDVMEVMEAASPTGLRVKIKDVYQARPLADAIFNDLSTHYNELWVSDWTRQHSNYFRAIQMQKSVMFIILLLIVAVAAFNLVSTLVMVVTDKESDIAILRTLGLTPSRVMRVFMVQGTLIGVIGTALGVVLGILLASNLDVIVPVLERAFDTNFISPDVYFISQLESRVDMSDVVVIAISALVLSMVATVYPAWRASKVQPAEALRYE